MTTAETQGVTKRALKGEFKGVTVIRAENGDLTFDVSALKGVNVNVITNGEGLITKQIPVEEQTNAPEKTAGVIASSVDVKSFQADNSMIRLGAVQLNKISPNLADMPDTATATLLVAPQDLANIDGGGLGTWDESIQRIREIKNYHGLDGMEIYDCPQNSSETAREISYEKAWSNQIKAAFTQAQSSGKEFTTGLFMPTKQLVHGRDLFSHIDTVDTNLYSKRKEIGKQGDEFITKISSGFDFWYWSAAENPALSSFVYGVEFTNGNGDWDAKDRLSMSARPVALALHPPA